MLKLSKVKVDKRLKNKYQKILKVRRIQQFFAHHVCSSERGNKNNPISRTEIHCLIFYKKNVDKINDIF